MPLRPDPQHRPRRAPSIVEETADGRVPDHAAPRPRCRPDRRRPHLLGGVRGARLGLPAPSDRVLAEMREVGLTATELRPDGFLPSQPEAMARVLDQHRLQAGRRVHPRCCCTGPPRPGPRGRPAPGRLRRLGRGRAGAVGRHRPGRLRHPAGAGRRRLAGPAGQPGPPGRPGREPGCGRCCTPTSAPWSRTAPRSSGSWRAPRSTSAWTPGTCSSAAPTRPSWPARPRSGSPTSTSRTSTPAWPGGSRTAG